MSQSTTPSTQQAPEQRWVYSPGWNDRLFRRVEALPGPSWIYYLIAWLALFLIEALIKWRDQAYPVGTFFPFHIVFTALGIYALALTHYLDKVATKAMHTYRAVFKGGDPEYYDLLYQLTHLPFWPALFSSLAGVGLAFVLALASPGSMAVLKLATSPLSQSVDGLLFIFQWWAWEVLIYHTVRQLRLVSRIYTQFTRLDLFNQRPLYVFSGLAARTAFGLVIFYLVVDATTPGAFSQPGSFGLTLFLVIMALVTFLWSLMGAHRQLLEEKGRFLGENTRRFLATTKELPQRVDVDHLSSMDEIDATLSSLAQEKKDFSDSHLTLAAGPDSLTGFNDSAADCPLDRSAGSCENHQAITTSMLSLV